MDRAGGADCAGGEMSGTSLETSVSTGGITFNFDAATPVGQFIQGDWWADISDGRSVTSISPPSVKEVRYLPDMTPTPDMWWNGAMQSPSSAEKLAEEPARTTGGSKQGFMEWSTNQSEFVPWYAGYNIDPAYTSQPISTPGGIVKLVTPSPIPVQIARAFQQEYASLFLLNGTPPTTAAEDKWFRPPIQHQTPAFWIKAKDSSGYLIDIDMFPSLEIPALERPSFAALWPKVSKLHECWYWNHGKGKSLTAPGQDINYGREHSKLTSNILLLLCSDVISLDEKYRLACAMTQHGIDFAGLYMAGGRHDETLGLGNTSTGRKAHLALAALVTDQEDLKDALADGIANMDAFVEDMQVVPVEAGDIGDPMEGKYPSEMLGRGEWRSSGQTTRPRSYWEVEPEPVDRGTYVAGPGVQYRHNWASGLVGTWLATRIVPELRALWDNDLFDDYFERFITFEQTRAYHGGNGVDGLGGGSNRFYRDFFEMYEEQVLGDTPPGNGGNTDPGEGPGNGGEPDPDPGYDFDEWFIPADRTVFVRH